MKPALTGALLVLAAQAAAPAAAATLTDVVKANRPSVVFLRVQKVVESTGAVTEQSGSGFIVNADGTVVTAHHVVVGGPGIQVDIQGATSSSAAQLEPMELVEENSNFDVAVLRFKNTAQVRKPVALGDPWKVGDGDTIYAMGFPIREEWFHTEGKLSGKGQKGSWSTTAVLNPGMSGGPVFNTKGQVVAIVWGGVATPGIVGINRVMPINVVSSMFSRASGPLALPIDGVEVAYRLDQVQESFNGAQPATRPYKRVFQAQPGFKIVDFSFVPRSINKADAPTISVTPDGQSMEVQFALTSGPIYDRWRGWLDGDIKTRQVAQP
jgi:S1-C subfamily serine protease